MVEICPHCGMQPKLRKLNDNVNRKLSKYQIFHECKHIKKEIASNVCTSRDRAIKSWNHNIELIMKYNI